jgi:hypothetical protein
MKNTLRRFEGLWKYLEASRACWPVNALLRRLRPRPAKAHPKSFSKSGLVDCSKLPLLSFAS